MDDKLTVGAAIKQLRKEKKMTLAQLAAKTDLSVGFLSQLERGLSTIAIDSLEKIAGVFEVPLTWFFEPVTDQNREEYLFRAYEQAYTEISPHIFQRLLVGRKTSFHLLPRLYLLRPHQHESETVKLYTHAGEEFIFVLEGMLTVFVNGQRVDLYPEDSVHIHSEEPHNWCNMTNRSTRFITVNFPNPLMENEKGRI